jgi:hypothetical protein
MTFQRILEATRYGEEDLLIRETRQASSQFPQYAVLPQGRMYQMLEQSHSIGPMER